MKDNQKHKKVIYENAQRSNAIKTCKKKFNNFLKNNIPNQKELQNEVQSKFESSFNDFIKECFDPVLANFETLNQKQINTSCEEFMPITTNIIKNLEKDLQNFLKGSSGAKTKESSVESASSSEKNVSLLTRALEQNKSRNENYIKNNEAKLIERFEGIINDHLDNIFHIKRIGNDIQRIAFEEKATSSEKNQNEMIVSIKNDSEILFKLLEDYTLNKNDSLNLLKENILNLKTDAELIKSNLRTDIFPKSNFKDTLKNIENLAKQTEQDFTQEIKVKNTLQKFGKVISSALSYASHCLGKNSALYRKNFKDTVKEFKQHKEIKKINRKTVKSKIQKIKNIMNEKQSSVKSDSIAKRRSRKHQTESKRGVSK